MSRSSLIQVPMKYKLTSAMKTTAGRTQPQLKAEQPKIHRKRGRLVESKVRRRDFLEQTAVRFAKKLLRMGARRRVTQDLVGVLPVGQARFVRLVSQIEGFPTKIPQRLDSPYPFSIFWLSPQTADGSLKTRQVHAIF